jgi:hypothetical protein
MCKLKFGLVGVPKFISMLTDVVEFEAIKLWNEGMIPSSTDIMFEFGKIQKAP